MARKRYITTDISLSGKVEALARRAGEYAVLLFTWLVPHTDDWGCMEGNPDKVFFTVTPRFAFLNRTPDDVSQALSAMHELDLLEWYEVDGERYIQLNRDTFYELQTYIPKDKRETDGSSFPAPLEPTPTQTPSNSDVTQSSADCYSVLEDSTESQQVAQNTPSPSPSPSPSLSPSLSIDRQTYAHARARDGPWGNIVRAYEQYTGGLMGGSDADTLGEFFDKLDPPVILKAFEQATGKSRHFGYVAKMLERWVGQGITTLADWEASEAEFRARTNKPRGGTGNGSRYQPYYEDDGYDWDKLAR